MRKSIRKIAITLMGVLLALSLLLFAACNGGNGVGLSKTKLTLKVGQSETLTVTASDDAQVSWSSSDSSVATVTGSGLVTAVSEGTCTITVRISSDTSVQTGTCAVTVTAADAITVTFMADGTIVATEQVAYGGDFDAAKFPAVPEKEGFTGVWDKTAEDLKGLKADVTVTAIYAENISYTVEIYVQGNDLAYTRESSESLTGGLGLEVSYTAGEKEGYLLDAEKSVLTITLAAEGENAIKVYYALPYKRVNVARADGTSRIYRVYDELGLVGDMNGKIDVASTFTLAEDTNGHYHSWNVNGFVKKTALTEADFFSCADGGRIVESDSMYELFNTTKNYAFLAWDGVGYSSEEQAGWTSTYLYFTGSSTKFYAKYTAAAFSGNDIDACIGFTLADAYDATKNAQLYLASNWAGAGKLVQNSVYAWEGPDGTTRDWLNPTPALKGDQNTVEIVISDGWFVIFLNDSFYTAQKIADILGPGLSEGYFADTKAFDLGIAQWGAHWARFMDVSFACGDEADSYIEARLPQLSLPETYNYDAREDNTLPLTSTFDGLSLADATWKSSDEAVVTVNGGVLTPVGAGTATVTATLLFAGQELSVSTVVTVTAYTVTFKSGETVVKVITVFNGGSVAAADYPALPEGSGNHTSWSKTLEELVGITENVMVELVGYKYGYTVEYYKQDAKDLNTYNKFDEQTMLTDDATSTVTPEAIANYTVNAEKSKLTGENGGATELVLTVYYDLIVASANVTLTIDGESKAYTAYYELGLYEGDVMVTDEALKLPAGYFWMVDDTYMFELELDKEFFAALTESFTAVRIAGSNKWSEDNAHATFGADGSVSITTTGWQGSHAFLEGHGNTFYIETMLLADNNGSFDIDASAGFTVGDNAGNSIKILLGYNTIKVLSVTWEPYALHEFARESGTGNIFSTTYEPVKLALTYINGTFSLYVNDTMILDFTLAETTQPDAGNNSIQQGLPEFNAEYGWKVGVANWSSHKATFSNTWVVFDADEIEKIFASRWDPSEMWNVANSKNATFQSADKSVYMRSTGFDGSYAYLNGKGTSFYVETTVSMEDYNKANTALAGFTVLGKDGQSLQVYIGDNHMTDGGSPVPVINVCVNHTWSHTTLHRFMRDYGEGNFTQGDNVPVKFALAYVDGMFYVYVNDMLVLDFTIEEAAQPEPDYGAQKAHFIGVKPVMPEDGWQVGVASFDSRSMVTFTNTSVTFADWAVRSITGVLWDKANSKNATVNADGSVYMRSTGWEGSYAYFNGKGTSFYAAAMLHAEDVNGNNNALVGFTVLGKNGASMQVYIADNNNLGNGEVPAINVTTDVTWSHETLHRFEREYGEGNFFTNGAAKIALAYHNGMFYVYVNDALVLDFTFAEAQAPEAHADGKAHFNKAVPEMPEDGWQVGLASFDSRSIANFSAMSVTFDESTVKSVTGVLWDKANVKDATFNGDGSVYMRSTGFNGAYAYLNGKGTSFYAETTVSMEDFNKGNTALAGFTVLGKDGQSLQVYIGDSHMTDGGSPVPVINVCVNHTWSHTTLHRFMRDYGEGNFTQGDNVPVKFALGYADGMFYVYVNDVLVLDFTIEEAAQPEPDYGAQKAHFIGVKPVMPEDGWQVGIASFDSRSMVTFTNTSVTFNAAEVAAKLPKA